MIGTQYIDQFVETTPDLMARISDVGGKIGVGAVRFDQRPIDVITELSRTEKRLLTVLPVLRQFALRRRQAAFIDEAASAQILDGAVDLAGLMQRFLRDEDFLANIQGGQIVAN